MDAGQIVTEEKSMDEGQELQVTEKKTDKPTPEDLLLDARDAAQALERVIELNDKPPMVFNGKRYLEFHHWQTIAKFYHCAVATGSAEPVEIADSAGFHAKATVIDEKTGLVIGGAEAFCMRDEPNWAKKPIYQLASMAQTRAASKALANKFRFVAVVAKYEGTPLEELPDEMKSNKFAPIKMPTEKVPEPVGVHAKAPPEGVSKFFVQLHKTVREKDIPDEAMKQMIAQMFNKKSSKELTDPEIVKLIKAVESIP